MGFKGIETRGIHIDKWGFTKIGAEEFLLLVKELRIVLNENPEKFYNEDLNVLLNKFDLEKKEAHDAYELGVFQYYKQNFRDYGKRRENTYPSTSLNIEKAKHSERLAKERLSNILKGFKNEEYFDYEAQKQIKEYFRIQGRIAAERMIIYKSSFFSGSNMKFLKD